VHGRRLACITQGTRNRNDNNDDDNNDDDETTAAATTRTDTNTNTSGSSDNNIDLAALIQGLRSQLRRIWPKCVRGSLAATAVCPGGPQPPPRSVSHQPLLCNLKGYAP